MRTIWTFGFLGLVLAHPAQASIAAAEKYQPGKVLIAFEGGVVGEDIGAVLQSIVKDRNLVPTKVYTVLANDTPCGILGKELGFPSPCSKLLLDALDIINPGSTPSSGRVSVGQVLRLPDVWLRKYRTARTLTTTIPAEQRRLSTIKSGWGHLKVRTVAPSIRTERVEFDAYELILSTANVEQQKNLLDRVTPFRSPNVRVTSIGFAVAPAQAFSVDLTAYQNEGFCIDIAACDPSGRNYRQPRQWL